ncbi:hypothetical protein ACROYT_G014030 [Oculina patagonica]
MHLPKNQRGEAQTRTLEGMHEHLREFKEKGRGDLKKAKSFFNVINEPLLEIPIDQICVPGLHISLGLFLKFYELLLDDCAVLDAKIATRKAETDEAAGDTDLDNYITQLRNAREHHQLARSYLEEAQQTVGYATYLITAGALIHTEEAPNPIVLQLQQHAQDMQSKATREETLGRQINECAKFSRDTGLVYKALEDTLQSINVKRQAYHSHSFVGNHIDICLKESSIQKITRTIVDKTSEQCPGLTEEAKSIERKFHTLFTLFAKCHFSYNASAPMKDEEITTLAQDICTFTNYFREQFPQATIPPKMHMLEDHVVSFIQKWHFPLGFFGEQGGESIHHEFVDLEATRETKHACQTSHESINMFC